MRGTGEDRPELAGDTERRPLVGSKFMLTAYVSCSEIVLLDDRIIMAEVVVDRLAVARLHETWKTRLPAEPRKNSHSLWTATANATLH